MLESHHVEYEKHETHWVATCAGIGCTFRAIVLMAYEDPELGRIQPQVDLIDHGDRGYRHRVVVSGTRQKPRACTL